MLVAAELSVQSPLCTLWLPLSFMPKILENILTVVVCRCKCFSQQGPASDLQEAHLLFVRYYIAVPEES